MGSTFLFAQQWTGASNTTGDISRTGKVSINTTNTNHNLSIRGNIGLLNVYDSTGGTPINAISLYDGLGPGNPRHVIATKVLQFPISSPFPGTYLEPALYIGSVADKSLVITTSNKVGIGTEDMFCTDCDDYRLFVKDGIRTEKIKVDIAANNGWADYVFEPDYNLMPLTEVEQFIKQNGHLPEVPTTAEAIANGIELKEMNILLLKKVEELTLYSIELQKRIEALESKQTNK